METLFICQRCRHFGIFDVDKDTTEIYCMFCRLGCMKKVGIYIDTPFVVVCNNQ